MVYCTPLYVACAYMLVPIISCTGVLGTMDAVAERHMEQLSQNTVVQVTIVGKGIDRAVRT